MVYFIIKIAVSAVLIALISEISKRSTLWGGILASVPLVSVLAMLWLYIDTESTEKISEFSTSVFWLVIPSLSLFIALPLLLRMKIHFYISLPLSIAIMIGCYYLMIFVLTKMGVKI